MEWRKNGYRLQGETWFRSSKSFEESKEREENVRLGGESFTWPVLKTDSRSIG